MILSTRSRPPAVEKKDLAQIIQEDDTFSASPHASQPIRNTAKQPTPHTLWPPSLEYVFLIITITSFPISPVTAPAMVTSHGFNKSCFQGQLKEAKR